MLYVGASKTGRSTDASNFSGPSGLSLGKGVGERHGACWEWVRLVCSPAVQTRSTFKAGSHSRDTGESRAQMHYTPYPKIRMLDS